MPDKLAPFAEAILMGIIAAAATATGAFRAYRSRSKLMMVAQAVACLGAGYLIALYYCGDSSIAFGYGMVAAMLSDHIMRVADKLLDYALAVGQGWLDKRAK